MKLVDTDIAIDHFHGHREALDYFTQALIDGESLAMSVVSLTEILAGMREGEQERTEKLFALFDAELVTRNLKHYPMGDVQVAVPYQRGSK